MSGPVRIAVFVSGGGSNLQALIDGAAAGRIPGAEIALVLSSSADAYALTRAAAAGIPCAVYAPNEYPSEETRNEALLSRLTEEKIGMIVLAGYMRILSPALVQAFAGRILNIHPSLIPKYCGMGFFGKRVHEAVLAGGERESGATVHYVDEGVDTGQIILQRKVPVHIGDTAETLAARVLAVEHEIIVEATALAVQGYLEKGK
jgi:phosphoribosylglycinamide formyltransferase-1